MDNAKDEGSINITPILDGTNYDNWKTKTDAYLKSIYNKIWKVVIKGWKHHVILLKMVQQV